MESKGELGVLMRRFHTEPNITYSCEKERNLSWQQNCPLSSWCGLRYCRRHNSQRVHLKGGEREREREWKLDSAVSWTDSSVGWALDREFQLPRLDYQFTILGFCSLLTSFSGVSVIWLDFFLGWRHFGRITGSPLGKHSGALVYLRGKLHFMLRKRKLFKSYSVVASFSSSSMSGEINLREHTGVILMCLPQWLHSEWLCLCGCEWMFHWPT